MNSFDNILTTGRIVRKMPTVIFDIDGTLANGKHREHLVLDTGEAGFKPDWNTFFSLAEQDTVYEDVRAILMAMDYQGYEIIILTARNSRYSTMTRRWLLQNRIPYATLIMKEQKHSALTAPEYKLHVLNELRDGGRNILTCFEDQMNVTRLLRDNGYSVVTVRDSFA